MVEKELKLKSEIHFRFSGHRDLDLSPSSPERIFINKDNLPMKFEGCEWKWTQVI